MADIDSIKKALEDDPELRRTLADLVKQDFSNKQVSDALAAAGLEVEPEQVEAALQDFQKKRAEQIAFQKVDADQLEKIAGGKTSDGEECDDAFNRYDGWRNCSYNEFCDEYYENFGS